jgi:hypothetical protein
LHHSRLRRITRLLHLRPASVDHVFRERWVVRGVPTAWANLSQRDIALDEVGERSGALTEFDDSQTRGLGLSHSR